MSRPVIAIDVLYTHRLFDIAVLTIYTNSLHPNNLFYELKDNLALLPQSAYLSGYIPITVAGQYYIEEGISEHNVATLVEELLAEIQAAYLSQSLTAYLPKRNMQYGLN